MQEKDLQGKIFILMLFPVHPPFHSFIVSIQLWYTLGITGKGEQMNGSLVPTTCCLFLLNKGM